MCSGANEKTVSSDKDSVAQRQNQLRILESFWPVKFNPSYDYKAERRKKRL